MQTLQMDEFLRSLKQNIDTPHALLLGAGASVESGVQSAGDCIWEWKKEIFLSQNPGMIGTYPTMNSVTRSPFLMRTRSSKKRIMLTAILVSWR